VLADTVRAVTGTSLRTTVSDVVEEPGDDRDDDDQTDEVRERPEDEVDDLERRSTTM
jgi:hypothetical protein